MKIRFLILIILVTLFACKKDIDAPNTTDWKSNIDYFATTLEANHKNLFFKLSKEDFYDQIETIKKQSDELNDVEIILELSKLLTRVGDAHTAIAMNSSCFTYLPFRFLYLNDGLFCFQSPSNYSELIGEVISEIDETDFVRIYQKYSEIIPHENEAKVKLGIENKLFCPEILEALDIISNKQSFKVKTKNNLEIQINTTAINSETTNYFSKKNLPQYLKNTNDNYWFESIPDKKTVYLQYNSCSEMNNYLFASYTKDVMKEVDEIGAEKMVIDLRWNGGGNSSIMNPLLKAIKEHKNINQNGHLFVIIGKNTFSSALLNALDLKAQTNATLIGEATGGKPNHYGEVKTFELNKLDIKVQYSTKYFKRVDGDPASLDPDVSIPINSEDMILLKDPCLEYVINQ